MLAYVSVYLVLYESSVLCGLWLRLRPLWRQTSHKVRIGHQLRAELRELVLVFLLLLAADADAVADDAAATRGKLMALLHQILAHMVPLYVEQGEQRQQDHKHKNNNNYHSLGRGGGQRVCLRHVMHRMSFGLPVQVGPQLSVPD